MSKKNEKPVEEQKTEAAEAAEVSHVELDTQNTLALSLAAERVQSADTMLKLRQSEAQAVVTAITAEYAENGKYKVTEINLEKRRVGRSLAS